MFNKIYDLCKACGLSISTLEERAGLGNGTVGKWKTSSPTVDKLKAVADVLGCTLDELIDD